MSTWIDFKELRSKLRIGDVLNHFKVELKVRGERASGFCPLPSHAARRQGSGEGKRHSPSFSVHLGKGLFQCFSCGGKGNVLDLVCLLQGLDPDDPAQLREGALQAQELFGMSAAKISESPTTPVVTSEEAAKQEATSNLPVVINAPLDFELKHLDSAHPYLRSRKFSPQTIEHFGLGYCGKGIMAGRVAIPLHDRTGQLIGYAGRIVDDVAIDDENPKYRFPSTRERNGKRYEFHKSRVLYNAHHLGTSVSDLVVVEGFASVWWLWAHGYSDVVAIMGSSCSPEQGKLIEDLVSIDGRVWVFSDGDAAGESCAQSVLTRVAPTRLVGWIRLHDKRQPTDCEADELEQLFRRIGTGKSGSPASPAVSSPVDDGNGMAAQPTAA